MQNNHDSPNNASQTYGNHMNAMQEMMNTMGSLEIEAKKADVLLKTAQADYQTAFAFQIKVNTILAGMNEIRLALGQPQINDEKESDSYNPDKIALKSIFSTERERQKLGEKYGQLLDLYTRVVMQLDLNKKNENDRID